MAGGRNEINASKPNGDPGVTTIIGGVNGVHIQGSNGNSIDRADISTTSTSNYAVFIEGGGGNLLYQNNLTGGVGGVRVKYDSFANFIIDNSSSGFQGTTSSTVNCNGDRWLSGPNAPDYSFGPTNVSCP